ncbi:hypothetical protein Tco_0952079 [Tanacetum coccineum]|uniref:Uncharacterized protein n=1 Tax=Tanacetum coccineum TaxID=301880 RepID=A0ABQ5E216_9ASTR
MFIEFVIQNQLFSYSLEEFAQILNIPCEGACVFTDKWSLDDLVNGLPMDGPYQTNPPSPDDIISYIQIDREDVPPRPSNPQPLQSHPSLDITVSLSPITPLDHIIDTPSPPSPQPQSQPPLMGHPIYFNYHDYHGSTCLCCFHNRNLIFSLRDEMNLMFAHLEYLLTTTMNSLCPPHP